MVLRGRADPGQVGQVAPAGAQYPLAHGGRRHHPVVLGLQRQARGLARDVRADVERAVQRAGADLLAQLFSQAGAGANLQQRQRLDDGRQQRAQAQRVGVGHGAQHELAGDFALQLARLAQQDAGAVQQQLGLRQRASPARVTLMRPGRRSNRATPSSSSSALICAVTAGCVTCSTSAARVMLPSLPR
jgi:hypothetical protein